MRGCAARDESIRQGGVSKCLPITKKKNGSYLGSQKMVKEKVKPETKETKVQTR